MTAPYWRDYLTRERTMCSLCAAEGRGWVRIGPPIPSTINLFGQKAAHISRQRAAFRRHVPAFHPDLSIAWSR